MTKERFPSTPAIRLLRQKGIVFELHPYFYEDRGGTEVAARELGVDESQVIKTIVMEDDGKSAFIVLMHGNKEISAKEMARQLQVKSVHPCDPHTVQKLTGYIVGGTSPFGTKRLLPVYMEKSISDLTQDLHKRRPQRAPGGNVSSGPQSYSEA